MNENLECVANFGGDGGISDKKRILKGKFSFKYSYMFLSVRFIYFLGRGVEGKKKER